jgi:predicted nucleic acid-binding protein
VDCGRWGIAPEMTIVTIVVFDAQKSRYERANRVAGATAKFGKIAEKARVSGPQTITKNGHPLGTMDVCIAAAAQRHRLTVVTRNVSDFDGLGTGAVTPRSKG